MNIAALRSALGHLVHPPLRADGRRSNATLYRHFPDRRDLLVAVCVTEVQAKHGPAEAFSSGREDSRNWLM